LEISAGGAEFPNMSWANDNWRSRSIGAHILEEGTCNEAH